MNTLKQFTRNNLSNTNLFSSFYNQDRDIILNMLYNKDSKIEDAGAFLDSFKGQYIKRNVLNNFEISQQRQNKRALIDTPCTGDVFIDDDGKKYRLVSFGDYFQFCVSGSFHMSENGYASMSGGFTYANIRGKEVYKIHKSLLTGTNKKEPKYFWFFMDNSSGANRGIYFNCEVKIYKTKTYNYK